MGATVARMFLVGTSSFSSVLFPELRLNLYKVFDKQPPEREAEERDMV
jgi:hypothetical protein